MNLKSLSARPALSSATRRGVLRTGAVGLAAPWVASPAKASGQLNVVLNQGLLAKLWIDELHPAFEKATGAKVNVQQSVTANMLAMLKTQRDNPPDLMQFSEAGVFLAAEEGLLRPHNAKNIANMAMLRPAFRLADDFSAGVIDAVHTLYYNTNAQKTRPAAWAEMWDASNARRIAIPPITWNSGVRMVTTAAQIATGKPMKDAQYDLEAGMRHLAALLMLASFVLLTAAYVPGNRIKARLRHPMVLGVKAWALAHLLANGQLLHLVVFGAFLVWAVLDYRAARQRDRVQPATAAIGTAGATGVTIAIGVVAWLVFTLWLHGLLIGVRPLG